MLPLKFLNYFLLMYFVCYITSQETQNMTYLHSFAFLDVILIISLQLFSVITFQQYNAAKQHKEEIH